MYTYLSIYRDTDRATNTKIDKEMNICNAYTLNTDLHALNHPEAASGFRHTLYRVVQGENESNGFTYTSSPHLRGGKQTLAAKLIQ